MGRFFPKFPGFISWPQLVANCELVSLSGLGIGVARNEELYVMFILVFRKGQLSFGVNYWVAM